MENKNKIIKIILAILGIIIGLKILKITLSIIFAIFLPLLIGGGLILIPILSLLILIGILATIGYFIYKFFIKKSQYGKKNPRLIQNMNWSRIFILTFIKNKLFDCLSYCALVVCGFCCVFCYVF